MKKNNYNLPMIEVKDLVIDFGETMAVKGINFEINKDELVTLLGPSGCGKTTTLNAIAGLLTPTSGKIIFQGKDVTKSSPQQRKLGFVFQSYALYPHMTVFKNIAFPLTNDAEWKRMIIVKNKKFKILKNQIIFKANGATIEELNEYENSLTTSLQQERDLHDEHLYWLSQKNKNLKDLINQNNILKSQSKTKITKLSVDYLDVLKVYRKKIRNLFLEKKSIAKKIENKLKNEIDIDKKLVVRQEQIEKEIKKSKDKYPNFKNELTTKNNKISLEIKQQLKRHLKNNKELIFEAKQENKKLKDEYKIKLGELKKNHNGKAFIVKKIALQKKYPHLLLKTLPSEYKKLKKENKSKNNTIFKVLKDKYSLSKEKLSYKEQQKVKVFQNKILSIKKAVEIAVLDIAEKVDIVKNLAKKPAQLSREQQQRVAIARAIVRKPRLLLMDEPFSNLDAKLRISMREWIKDIQTQLGITTILVTHDQEEAMSISDKIINMSVGKIQQIGKPMDLYNKPTNKFVAQFLGVPEMILLNGEIKNKQIIIDGKKIASSKLSNNKILVGIRGEHVVEENSSKKYNFEVLIKHIEYLGKEIQCVVDFNDKTSGKIFLSNKEKYEIGQKVHIKIDPLKLHLFDPKTGERIENV